MIWSRFCQLIEGSEAQVGTLMHSITGDPRHTAVKVLFAKPCGARRAARNWVSGYCGASELERFDGDAGLRDAAALDAFLSVLAEANVE